MIGVTAFGLLLTPVFYVLVRRFRKVKPATAVETDAAEATGTHPRGAIASESGHA
jgi:hypothetical protein